MDGRVGFGCLSRASRQRGLGARISLRDPVRTSCLFPGPKRQREDRKTKQTLFSLREGKQKKRGDEKTGLLIDGDPY